MVINYPSLMNDISKPNASLCKFSTFITCDNPSSFFGMITIFLLDIPFYYFAIQMMRKNRFTLRGNFAPGVCFCIVKVFVDVSSIYLVFMFYYPTDAIDRTPLERFKYVTYDIKYLAQALYCSQICQILILFGVKFSRWLNFFSRLMQSYFTTLAIVKIILQYINDVRNDSFYNPFYIKYNRINEKYICAFMVSLNFLLLAVCFLFSSVGEYLPPKLRKPTFAAIFLVAFFFIIGTILPRFALLLPPL